MSNNSEVEISLANGKIVVKLPITRPTSKVRVKKIENGIGIPVPPRKTHFPEREDELRAYYIEWQISYSKDGLYDYELSKIVKLAYRAGILSERDIKELLEFVDGVSSYLEDKGIWRKSTKRCLHGFELYEEVYPVAKKELPTGEFIEIVLKHKQRAVGYQSMVYVCIPLTNIRPSLAGRSARKNEIVEYEVPPELIKETLKAFIIASESHKKDVIGFLLRSVKG
ncbi:R.Pab1 family restriction endonuclease [Pyrococcus kukulkanii]|uniref:R.Pab1 family restriction endonuclease n=1 Tax=Pyrococcus kukulkanii TaxID=1609559 RepID=UPI003567E385